MRQTCVFRNKIMWYVLIQLEDLSLGDKYNALF